MKRLSLAALLLLACLSPAAATSPGAMIYGTDAVTTAPAVTPPSSVDAWFTNGNGTSVQGTQAPDYWFNKVGGEIEHVITQAGLTVDMTNRTQLYAAFQALFAIDLPFVPVQQGGGVNQSAGHKIKIGVSTDVSGRLGADADGADLGALALITDVLNAEISDKAYTDALRANVTAVPGLVTSSLNLGRPGYLVMANGLIEEWGGGTIGANGMSANNATVTFPLAFPHFYLTVTGNATGAANSTSGSFPSFAVVSPSTTGFLATIDTLTGGQGTSAVLINQSVGFTWFAIGY